MHVHKQCADYAAIIGHCLYWQYLLSSLLLQRSYVGPGYAFSGLGPITLPARGVEANLLVYKTTALGGGRDPLADFTKKSSDVLVLRTGHMELHSQNLTPVFFIALIFTTISPC